MRFIWSAVDGAARPGPGQAGFLVAAQLPRLRLACAAWRTLRFVAGSATRRQGAVLFRASLLPRPSRSTTCAPSASKAAERHPRHRHLSLACRLDQAGTHTHDEERARRAATIEAAHAGDGKLFGFTAVQEGGERPAEEALALRPRKRREANAWSDSEARCSRRSWSCFRKTRPTSPPRNPTPSITQFTSWSASARRFTARTGRRCFLPRARGSARARGRAGWRCHRRFRPGQYRRALRRKRKAQRSSSVKGDCCGAVERGRRSLDREAAWWEEDAR